MKNFLQYNGLFAENWMKNEGDLSTTTLNTAHGIFLSEQDYFEKEKNNLLKQFESISLDDEISVYAQRQQLI